MALAGYLVYPISTVAGTAMAAAFMYFAYPATVLRWYIRYQIYYAGMKLKYVNGKDLVFGYSEKNKPQPGRSTLLLVHGFSAGQDMWLPLVRHLPSDLHIVIVDLPGHGYTPVPPDDEDLSLPGLVSRLHEFVTLIGLDTPFHLIGTSMGGAIAGIYAARHSDQVERVTLVCPAMRTPEASSFANRIRSIVTMETDNLDDCILIPQTTEQLKAMLDNVFNKPVYIPAQILKGVLQVRLEKDAFLKRLFKSITSIDMIQMLEKSAPDIKAPAQVIWGKQDKIVDVSGADLLRSVLPDCRRVDLIDQCGHSTNWDRPGAMTKAILQFRGELADKKTQ